MKKAFLTAWLLLLAPLAPASELRGLIGVNWNKYLAAGEMTDLSWRSKSGTSIGLGWAFDLDRRLQLEVEALFSTKGAKVELAYDDSGSIPGIYQNTTIAIPVLCRFRAREGASPYAAIGPELDLILAHHLILPESGESIDLSDNTRKIIIGFDALIGYQIPVGSWKLFAELRYSRWLNSMLKLPGATVKGESFAVLLGGSFDL